MNIIQEGTNRVFQCSNPSPGEVIEKWPLIFREASLGYKKFRMKSHMHVDKVTGIQYSLYQTFTGITLSTSVQFLPNTLVYKNRAGSANIRLRLRCKMEHWSIA